MILLMIEECHVGERGWDIQGSDWLLIENPDGKPNAAFANSQPAARKCCARRPNDHTTIDWEQAGSQPCAKDSRVDGDNRCRDRLRHRRR